MGADFAKMHLISEYDRDVRSLICVFDVYNIYACLVPLKYRKSITVINSFQKIIDKSKRKPNKIWVDQDNEFGCKIMT